MSSGSQYLLNERILVAWEDGENGATRTLGSCSLLHRQAINLSMKEAVELGTGRSYVYFSLVVGTKGRLHKEIRMIFLPHTFKNLESPLVFESLQISNITNSSILQESDLTKSGHIIRVRFDLASQGFVVQRKSENPIKLTTATSRNLVRGFKSLSTTLSFDVYMRQSTYAMNYLDRLNIHLCSSTIGISPMNLTGLFEGRDAISMKWPDLQFDNEHQILQEKPLSPPPPPPLYEEEPSPAQTPQKSSILRKQPPPLYTVGSSRVQIPQSPPNTRREETTQPTTEIVLAETPHRTSIHDSPIPPTASPTSERSIINMRAELENNIEGLGSEKGPDDDYYATLQARESSLDREAAKFEAEGLENEIDSDEEHYATIHARELSLDGEIASVSTRLSSELTEWLVGATEIHNDLYKHRRLTSRLYHLGYYVRTQNTKAFNSTMIWCSTILFCDPLDSGSIPELWSASSRSLISDLAGIIQWSNTSCRSPEMCLSHMRDEFLKLGSALRAVAELASQRNLAEYKRQRARCIAVVLQEFGGRPGISGGEEKRFRL